MKPILEYILNRDTKFVKQNGIIKPNDTFTRIIKILDTFGFENLGETNGLRTTGSAIEFFYDQNPNKPCSYAYNDPKSFYTTIYVCNKNVKEYKYIGIRFENQKLLGMFYCIEDANWKEEKDKKEQIAKIENYLNT
jgi:hypothetical protein